MRKFDNLPIKTDQSVIYVFINNLDKKGLTKLSHITQIIVFAFGNHEMDLVPT